MNNDIFVNILMTFGVLLMIGHYYLSTYLYDRKLKAELANKPDTGKFVDFFDELKNFMSAAVNDELTYADPYLGRYVIYKSINNRSLVNNKRIQCETVKIKFMLQVFKDGRRTIQAYTESHYGNPQLYGGEMHYNYDIGERTFSADVSDFNVLWKNIIEHYFGVKLNGINDQIKINK